MKSLTLVFLALLVSVFAFTPLMSANAEVQFRIRFNSYALGKCLLVYGDPRYISGEVPPVWHGNALGKMALKGYAKATSCEEIDADVLMFYGMAYFTAPGGYVDAIGFLSVKWFENNELHQLGIAIYSKPISQGIFLPDTDKFMVGLSPPLVPVESSLSYQGIYKIGSNFQYLSGGASVWATKGERSYYPFFGIESIWVSFSFGDYIMQTIWVSELYDLPTSWGPWTIPAATMLVREVKLL